MKSKLLRSSALGIVLALSLFFVSSSFGQAVTGSIVGSVTDSSGGAVPNATVMIREMNTGITRSASTNESGVYSFPALEPGLYSVSVEHQGFRKAVKDRVQVLVNSTVRADLALSVGAVTESVTVQSEVAILQTDRADTGRKLEEKQITDLPLAYGRQVQSLLNLVPGTSRAFAPHSEFFNSQGSLTTQVNGLSRLANNVQLEGVDNNHRTGLLTVLIPPAEALATVDVSTSNYEAELGRAGGAVTNLQIKSGSNDIHGGVYEFNRVSRLGARDTFAPTKPVTTYNQYGVFLGGPIRKNRTFVFGDYQGTKDRRGDAYTITVPTAPFRAGDFSSLLPSVKIYDPATGDPLTGTGKTAFANNVIPTARINANPTVGKILALVPLPNFGAPGQLTNNYASATTRILDRDSFDVKVDHQQTDNDHFSVRYSFQRPVVTDPGRFGIAGGGGKGFAATGINRTQSAGIGYTHVFSPSLLTEARLGLSRYSNVATNLDSGTNAAQAIGIPGANLDNWSSGLTSINVGGFANPLVGYVNSLPWNRAETNIDMVNNWTKVFHNHTIKFGVDLRRIRDELLQTQDAGGPRGEIQFGNNQSAIAGSTTNNQGNGLASFLVDTPSTVQRDLAVAFPAYRAWMLFTYIQDTWQVSSKLTVNLGLRHDFYPPATPRLKGGFSNYDPGTNSLIVSGYGNNPDNLGRQTYYKDFAPRIGIAYRLNSKTVIRLGAGISWIPFPDNTYAYNFPVKQNNVYGTQNTFGRAVISPGVYGSMLSGFPAPSVVAIPANGIIAANTTQLLAGGFAVIPKDYHEGYVESWNLAVQHQLPKNFTLDVAYVANHTVRAPLALNINASKTFNTGAAGRPLFAAFGKNVDVADRYVGISNNYQALQIKFDRRFSSGFSMTTAYTWSKALGLSSEDGGLQYYINPRRNYERLDFDRTQNFVQSYTYELPFGPKKHWLHSGPGRWVFGDWQINGVLSAMTGRPMNFSTTISANTPGSSLSPDLVAPLNITHNVAGPSGTVTWFDTTAFAQPLNADGKTPHFGNMGRNNVSGPGLFDLDLSVFRNFQINERINGQFRFETANFTNTPAFAAPNTQVGSSDFGRITSTLNGLINNQSIGGTGPRQVTLAVRFTF